MFDLGQLKNLLNDVKALPDGWHPEPESVFRLQLSFGTSGTQDNSCLTVKDKQGVIVCIIPSIHLFDCQMELASAIAIWRKVIPFLICDTIARDIRLNEIRELIKKLDEEDSKGQVLDYDAVELMRKINVILDRVIEEDEIEKQEPESPGRPEPA